jgi:hypothetical protein
MSQIYWKAYKFIPPGGLENMPAAPKTVVAFLF